MQVTLDHLRLLKAANIRWNDSMAGAPAIDPKRPYGSTHEALDIAEELEWDISPSGLTEEQEEAAIQLHKETCDALRKILKALPLTEEFLSTINGK